MRHEIKSVLEQISESIFKMKDLDKTKQFIFEFLKNKEIKDIDKEKMIKDISDVKTMEKLWFYITNALLKYEGMGTNQMRKTSKQAASDEANEIYL